ncbi:dimethylaniline monooxygenase [N-oxide-forming] 2-like isoform X1 [Ammospiza nelsoni]|uniref:dimethylaniline monooxygenase [N-oxide-forming] 2-like isoform X1 n=1 Tax=Ammospiza nelsoni TaxID=2857394 RepID=UPI00286BF801|nr:dimethylaniline monooxygenase [N-oxide-forming] 2-like isoform X1 [Ammospiza nelsoni]
MVRRVAVIGAGAGGLASIKCCLDEGLEPTCFEQSQDIGGVWRYTDSTDSKRITVYRSVITNTSKEMSCFSDFPFPEDFPNYLPHSLVLEYLRMYTQHFNLLRHIRFQTTVLSVRKCPDFSTSGRWEVVTESHGVRESHVFDAVMVCTGHYQEPYLPLASFPGIESHFKGQYLHSWEYRDVQAFRGKRVLVLGIGNTGGDLSVELSRVAAKVFLSTRSHTWVVSRVSDQGFPMDMVSTTRFNSLLDWLLPSALTRRIKFRKFNSWFNHTNYGLASSKRWIFLVIIINEELPFCLLSGAVVLKPNVKEFTENSAVFEDGTTEGNIDVVLFATGYNFSFPFLEESVRGSIHDNRSLYNCIFPPQLEQPTLAIIGLIQLTGSIMVGSEMQARWVTGVFAGWNKLPPPSRMMAEVLKRKPAVKRCVMLLNPSERENLKMSFISYVDKIAACAGVKPSVLKLLLTDPKLGLAIFFGPCSPYQYRLQGRGSWIGARAAILTQWQRSLRPLRTRVLRDSSSSSWGWSWMCLLALPAALTAAWLCSKHPQAGWSPRL